MIDYYLNLLRFCIKKRKFQFFCPKGGGYVSICGVVSWMGPGGGSHWARTENPIPFGQPPAGLEEMRVWSMNSQPCFGEIQISKGIQIL